MLPILTSNVAYPPRFFVFNHFAGVVGSSVQPANVRQNFRSYDVQKIHLFEPTWVDFPPA